MSEKLARVHWEMGQALLPEHLVALEESILTDTMMRFRIQGLPFFGVGALRFNNALLNEGILSMETFSFVSGSGRLILAPGNAKVAPLSLESTGMASVSVYLHLMESPEKKGGALKGGDQGDAVVKRRYIHLELSAEQNLAGAFETVKLVVASKNPEGIWSLSPDYFPPLIQMGASPFFKEELESLSEALELFRYNLTMDSSSYLNGDSLFSVKQCLKSVMKTQRVLASIQKGVHMHPYHLYEEVQTLYADVCFFRNANPEKVTQPYDHTNPMVMKEAMHRLMDQMQLVKARPVYVGFKRQDNLYQVALPEDVRQAADVYFLVQKHQTSDRISVENLKIAGAARLPFVHKMALHGIPIRKVERPPFQHTFGAEVEFYQIRESEEWDHALNEKSLAFFNRPDLSGADYYVYWRMGA
ncbi:MAG: type VI secretion system baseplate subunit TssK [Desulfobacterales bacterium]|nr:type VI secretion system baseplate subunit TssK [Desulfobacterales bacterium]